MYSGQDILYGVSDFHIILIAEHTKEIRKEREAPFSDSSDLCSGLEGGVE